MSVPVDQVRHPGRSPIRTGATELIVNDPVTGYEVTLTTEDEILGHLRRRAEQGEEVEKSKDSYEMTLFKWEFDVGHIQNANYTIPIDLMFPVLNPMANAEHAGSNYYRKKTGRWCISYTRGKCPYGLLCPNMHSHKVRVYCTDFLCDRCLHDHTECPFLHDHPEGEFYEAVSRTPTTKEMIYGATQGRKIELYPEDCYQAHGWWRRNAPL